MSSIGLTSGTVAPRLNKENSNKDAPGTAAVKTPLKRPLSATASYLSPTQSSASKVTAPKSSSKQQPTSSTQGQGKTAPLSSKKRPATAPKSASKLSASALSTIASGLKSAKERQQKASESSFTIDRTSSREILFNTNNPNEMETDAQRFPLRALGVERAMRATTTMGALRMSMSSKKPNANRKLSDVSTATPSRVSIAGSRHVPSTTPRRVMSNTAAMATPGKERRALFGANTSSASSPSTTASARKAVRTPRNKSSVAHTNTVREVGKRMQELLVTPARKDRHTAQGSRVPEYTVTRHVPSDDSPTNAVNFSTMVDRAVPTESDSVIMSTPGRTPHSKGLAQRIAAADTAATAHASRLVNNLYQPKTSPSSSTNAASTSHAVAVDNGADAGVFETGRAATTPDVPEDGGASRRVCFGEVEPMPTVVDDEAVRHVRWATASPAKTGSDESLPYDVDADTSVNADEITVPMSPPIMKAIKHDSSVTVSIASPASPSSSSSSRFLVKDFRSDTRMLGVTPTKATRSSTRARPATTKAPSPSKIAASPRKSPRKTPTRPSSADASTASSRARATAAAAKIAAAKAALSAAKSANKSACKGSSQSSNLTTAQSESMPPNLVSVDSCNSVSTLFSQAETPLDRQNDDWEQQLQATPKGNGDEATAVVVELDEQVSVRKLSATATVTTTTGDADANAPTPVKSVVQSIAVPVVESVAVGGFGGFTLELSSYAAADHDGMSELSNLLTGAGDALDGTANDDDAEVRCVDGLAFSLSIQTTPPPMSFTAAAPRVGGDEGTFAAPQACYM